MLKWNEIEPAKDNIEIKIRFTQKGLIISFSMEISLHDSFDDNKQRRQTLCCFFSMHTHEARFWVALRTWALANIGIRKISMISTETHHLHSLPTEIKKKNASERDMENGEWTYFDGNECDFPPHQIQFSQNNTRLFSPILCHSLVSSYTVDRRSLYSVCQKRHTLEFV